MKSREFASKRKVYNPEYENFVPLMLPKVAEIDGNMQPSSSDIKGADECCLYETVPVGDLHQFSRGDHKSAFKAGMQFDEEQVNQQQDVHVSFPCKTHHHNKRFVAELNERIHGGFKTIKPDTGTKPHKRSPNPKQMSDADYLLPSSSEHQSKKRLPSQTVASQLCKQDIDRNSTDTEYVPAVYVNMMNFDKARLSVANTKSSHDAVGLEVKSPPFGAMKSKEIVDLGPSGEQKVTVHDDDSLMYTNYPPQVPTKIEMGMTKSYTIPTMTTGTNDQGPSDLRGQHPMSPSGSETTNFRASTNDKLKENSKKTVKQKVEKIHLVLPVTQKPCVSPKPLMLSVETKLPARGDCKMTQKADKGLRDAIKMSMIDKDFTMSTISLDSDEKIPFEKSVKANPNASLVQSIPMSSDGKTLQMEPSQDQAGNVKQIKVRQMTVNELGVWMSEKLRLGKYVSIFAEEMIDGAMLMDLEEDIFKTSFGFSAIEAKRLRKFAMEGYVPT